MQRILRRIDVTQNPTQNTLGQVQSRKQCESKAKRQARRSAPKPMSLLTEDLINGI